LHPAAAALERNSPGVLHMVAESAAIAALDATVGEGGEEVANAAEVVEVVVAGEDEEAAAGEEGEEEVAAVVKTNVTNAPIVLLRMGAAAVMFGEGEAAAVSWDEGSVEVEVVE